MNENKPTRCMECPHIGYNRKLEYYPNWYCKVNGQEVNFSEKNGWQRMVWCPLDKEDDDNGNK